MEDLLCDNRELAQNCLDMFLKHLHVLRVQKFVTTQPEAATTGISLHYTEHSS